MRPMRSTGSSTRAPSMNGSSSTRDAARAVIEDTTALIRAEIALAKTEIEQAARRKSVGAALLAGAGALSWLGLQGLLVTVAFAIAAAGLPGWAAAGIVTVLLLLGAAILALVGRRALAAKLSLDTTKECVEEDVAFAKAHLPSRDV